MIQGNNSLRTASAVNKGLNDMSRYLCVDLGTTTGFAVGSVGAVASGTWKLKHDERIESRGARFLRLRRALDALHAANPISLVVYEEVRAHKGNSAARAFGSYEGELQSWCEANKVEFTSTPVGTVKKSWTGKGNATKDHMVAEAERRGWCPADDNEADALAIMNWTLTEFEGKAAADQTMNLDAVPAGAVLADTKRAA